MDLTPYLAQLRDELDRATSLADDETRRTAAKLVDSLDAALRLTSLRLLSDAAAELTTALDDRVVRVVLDGEHPVLTVDAGPEPTSVDLPAPTPADESEGTARITLRLPDTLKSRADQAASAQNMSLNTWIVSACRAALAPAPSPTPRTTSARRVTGWA